MLAELFGIAKHFFFLAVIIAIIIFTYSLIVFLNRKRYTVIKALFLSILIAIGTYILGCILISIITFLFMAYFIYALIIIIVVCILMGIFGT